MADRINPRVTVWHRSGFERLSPDGHYDATAHHQTQTGVLKPGDSVRGLPAEEVARLRSMGVVKSDEPIADDRHPLSIECQARREAGHVAKILAQGPLKK